MKVCLIFPRIKYQPGDPPLGIIYVASELLKNKIDVDLIDLTFNPKKLDYISEYFSKNKPDFAGIYFDTLMYNDGIKIINIIKQYNIPIIAGGPHSTVLPESLTDHADAVVIGEGEKTFIGLLNKYPKLENVDGIVFKKNGKIIRNKPRQSAQNLDELNFPALHLLDMENYIKNWHYLDSLDVGIRGTNLIASRGCPFQCTYCQPTLDKLFGKKIRLRNPENVIAELKLLKDKYNLGGFFLHDDTLTANHDWVKKFCDLLIKENLGMVWSCNTRVNTINEELMKIMHEAGLRGFHLGVEAGSQRIVDEIYKKGIKLSEVKPVVDAAKKIGIHTLCFFMIGAPTETVKEINQTIKFARSLKADEATFSITSPLPHTGLHDYITDRGYKLSDNFADFDYYSKRAFNDPNLPYKKLKKLQKKALFLFYTHPYRWKYIMKHFASMKGIKKMMLKIGRFK